MPLAAAKHCAISFAPNGHRFAYAIDRQALDSAADEALKEGYVADEKGYRFEIQL